MAKKKAKLKVALQKALLSQPSASARPKQPVTKPSHQPQHDPENMTVRHVWSDGVETVLPFRATGGAVLVIGDGDLSFTAALAEQFPEMDLIGSTLDDRETLKLKYGQGCLDRIGMLEGLGVKVIHGLDGTRLHQSQQLQHLLKQNHPISTIVFNFPHTGAGIKDRDRNIRAQQSLCLGFLKSCSALLQRTRKSRCSRVVTRAAIVRGKASPVTDQDDPESIDVVPEVLLTVWQGDPYDDWNVKGLGKSVEGLKFVESFRFEPGKYPGYKHVRTVEEEAGLYPVEEMKKPSKTFVFRPVI